MFGLFALGALALAGMVVFGTLAAVASMVCWLLFLPFRLLGWVFQAFTTLLMLPLILLACVVGAVFFGVGVVMLFVPVLPFLLIALFFVWWFRRRSPAVPGRV
jgi:hypothetical protein